MRGESQGRWLYLHRRWGVAKSARIHGNDGLEEVTSLIRRVAEYDIVLTIGRKMLYKPGILWTGINWSKLSHSHHTPFEIVDWKFWGVSRAPSAWIGRLADVEARVSVVASNAHGSCLIINRSKFGYVTATCNGVLYLSSVSCLRLCRSLY